MRPVLIGSCLRPLALFVRCNPVKYNTTPVVDAGPKWGATTPRADELVAYLNRNAQGVTSIEARDAFIKAKQGDEAIDLVSYVACQKGARPGTAPNFRLQSFIVGNSEVDIG